MTVLERYAEACFRVADARIEVEVAEKAVEAAVGTPIHATMKAVAVDAASRLFAAEGDAVERQKAVLRGSV